ncbi:hypothetical protein ACTI_21680 [Actinoplanes sp. OR16]|uniref:Hansenula MRAKII killer toxin-resistant protein 1 n=1 Tax=Actinoplanes sp. OR16 TaxID=946334 RepID=UPI000F70E191|nr:Hansenula MRAKII killer toxin-resistant protein 1 [Actinoplanes sp. OR16]BBH65483.1 hypothetical protein ACTI_21680 [Actinoplanes sp. OR16]
MADKGWTSQAAAAAGIAAGAGAAQLGLGYGLGVLVWPATATGAEDIWLGSLGWATWITASATVLGAVIAGRLRPDPPGRWRPLWRFALAAASAIGALVSVALVALPARSAVRTDTLSPQLVAGGYALAGLLAGLVVAFWAVSSGPVAANLIGTAIWLWALAIAGVVAELVTGRDFATYLTSWQFAESAVSPTIQYGGIYWPSALLTLAAAFVIGLISAWPAASRGETGLGTAISGAVGPLLVAFSFLLLAPQLTEAMGPLQSAYLIAPYAVLSGLAGSALTTTLAKSRQNRRNRPDLVPVPMPHRDDADPHSSADTTADLTQPAGQAQPADQVIPGDEGITSPSARSEAQREAFRPEASSASGRKPTPAPRQPLRPEPTPISAPLPTPKPTGPPPSAPPASPAAPATANPAKAKATAPAPAPASAPAPAPAPANPAKPPTKATGRATATPKDDPSKKDAPPVFDPEIAAAARPSRNPAKRPPARKGENDKPEPRSTITPPPPNPTVARINPADPEQ